MPENVDFGVKVGHTFQNLLLCHLNVVRCIRIQKRRGRGRRRKMRRRG